MTMRRQHLPWDKGRAHALIVGAPSEERNTIASLLVGEKIVPATTDSAGRAFETLSDSSFDLVVTDMGLKGRSDGIGLVLWMRLNHPDTAVILLADTFPWIPASSLLTAVPVLMRPLNFDVLLEKVRHAVPAKRDAA